MPIVYKDKNSFISIINSNAPKTSGLFAKNKNDRAIEITNLEGVIDCDINIITIGIIA